MTESKPETVTSTRIQRFASFFKNYMGVSAVVTAALPIPITVLGAIPVYASQKASLATYTSLLCFLLLAYLFYIRHAIGSILFVHRHRNLRWARILEALPLLLILGCIASVYGYHALLTDSTRAIKGNATVAVNPRNWPPELNRIQFEPMGSVVDGKHIYGPTAVHLLATQGADEIPSGTLIMSLYLAIFICAEGAFVLMALREHLQDLLQYEDKHIMTAIADEPK